jgi:hypothetical protein
MMTSINQNTGFAIVDIHTFYSTPAESARESAIPFRRIEVFKKVLYKIVTSKKERKRGSNTYSG